MEGMGFQSRRKLARKGLEFTLMVVGESGLGKSTLVNSLYDQQVYPKSEIEDHEIKKTVAIDTFTVDIEDRGVRLKLTVVDTPGFGDAVNNDNCWKPIIDYVNAQYDNYFRDESGLNRRNLEDHRVHCCLYFVNPSVHGLRPIDVRFMKELHELVNIIPVIAKADTLTPSEIKELKQKVLKEIQQNKIQVFIPDLDEEDSAIVRDMRNSVPFTVIGSDKVIEVKGKKVRGRQYPWGVAEVENREHSDFALLRHMMMQTHMQDLKDLTQEIHYENYRKKKLMDGENGFNGHDVGGEGPQKQVLEKQLAEMQQKMALLMAKLSEKEKHNEAAV
jgi:septin family protein